MTSSVEPLAGVPEDWPTSWHDDRLLQHPLFSSCLGQHAGKDSEWEDAMILSTGKSLRVAAVVKRWVTVAFRTEHVFITPWELTDLETRAFWRVLYRLKQQPGPGGAAKDVMRMLSNEAPTLYQRPVIIELPRPPTEPRLPADMRPPDSYSRHHPFGATMPPPSFRIKNEPDDTASPHSAYESYQAAAGTASSFQPSGVPPVSSLALTETKVEEVQDKRPAKRKRKRVDETPAEAPPAQRSRIHAPKVLPNINIKQESPSPDADPDTDADADDHPRTWREYLPTSKPLNRPISFSGLLPAVWATTRSELCESMPWFRSYQGGVYSHDGLAHGYLLATSPAPRDQFLHSGRVIISHGGGGSQVVELDAPATAADDDGESVDQPPTPTKRKIRVLKQVKDQVPEAGHVRPLFNSYKNCHPVLLIANRLYALFPYELSEKMKFVVLGWYFIASVWEEAEPDATVPKGYLTRTKLKFQWIESQGEPWWLEHTSVRAVRSTTKAEIRPTTTAPRKVREISLTSAPIPPNTPRCSLCSQPARQVYEQGWMCLEPRCRAFWRLSDENISPYGAGLTYHPDFVALEEPPRTFLLTSYTDLPGWCSYCGRLSCRRRWETWYCDGCRVSRPVNMEVYSARELDMPVANLYTISDPAIYVDKFALRISEQNDLAWVHRFVLPIDRGIIYHILCPDAIRDSVDELFTRAQREIVEAASYRRQVMRQNRVDGMLTRYFAQNYGVRYKYIAETETTIPFEEAQSFIKDSLALITSHVQRIVESVRFNELLAVAYMDGHKMNYHSDSEPGMEDDIAGLSLGSPAHMSFRTKGDKLAQTKPKKCLTVSLRHGDVLLMHGVNIQNAYEHTVVATGLRIAATARYIDENQV